VFSNGEVWATNRKLANPAFHRADLLDNWAPIIAEESNRLVDVYKSLPSGAVVDVSIDIRYGTYYYYYYHYYHYYCYHHYYYYYYYYYHHCYYQVVSSLVR